MQLLAEQAKSASPERARALEDLSASIEKRPPFFVDVLRPELLGWPEVAHLLNTYGTDAAGPERFLQAIRDVTPYRGPTSGLEVLLDGVIAGLEWLGRRMVRWWRERAQT